eukprot:Lithocolla_globosa_v1_NODE_24_length_9285_cov_66.491832.p9 type:complete len:126 gc:universal NODE_24_length_9285_cov_66.491832:8641-8264(-)
MCEDYMYKYLFGKTYELYYGYDSDLLFKEFSTTWIKDDDDLWVVGIKSEYPLKKPLSFYVDILDKYERQYEVSSDKLQTAESLYKDSLFEHDSLFPYNHEEYMDCLKNYQECSRNMTELIKEIHT